MCSARSSQTEGELAAVECAFDGQLGGLELVQYLLGNFFGRIAVIRGKAVQHLFVPNPVLQHLRRRFDEIARHARAGEAGVFGAGQNRVHGVAEFVEERFHVLVRRAATACPGWGEGKLQIKATVGR